MVVTKTIDLIQLKKEIKTEAKSLGFSHIGFTTSDEPVHFDVFKSWIENGFAADMHYLLREDTIAKRKNPNLILESTKSIIVLAIPYCPSIYQKDEFPKIASYAIGDDYHLVIPPLLEKIVDFIKRKIGSLKLDYKTYTDTGPILEKDLAQRAGLGWIGKNTCLIIPGEGSFFLLAEIFINLEFESDPSFSQDFCGQCSKCIESCPTSCILPNRTIDSNKCISYLTIENKKDIPEEFRSKIDGWIFGCDICQQVCPWNIRFAKKPEKNYFNRSIEISTLNIHEELNIDKPFFKKKYKNSPISRAKYEGFIRNLLICIGNHSKNDYESTITEFISTNTNPELSVLANWVLEKKYRST
ncbi:MAG TPA: tRNA epoxyqueuosine(34) reductase QueG [Anaerolineaceae bacterium]|nr:tRNA epoxyqueuosine(34) reductase QueG [Anaerolineaceae bacterium]